MSVNIVYPISGGNYPIRDPASPVRSAYITASFSVTCGGGPQAVKWGFDNLTRTLGRAKFYDQISVQFTYKLARGRHIFWVDAGNCGKKRVRFNVR